MTNDPLGLQTLPASEREALRRTEQPTWTAPMLATLTEARFSDPAWIFERKLDGERCLAFVKGGRVRLRSRNELDVSSQYPELVEALRRRAAVDLVADGEIVAFEGSRTSFARLQRRMHVAHPSAALQRSARVFYYLFDLLHADGFDVTGLPQRSRKALLRKAIRFADPLRFTVHRNRDGEAFYAEACRKGWEGLIAKRADASYQHARSKNWLKFKCVGKQEFVIGGFTDPKGSRTGLGALLLGYHDQDRKLRYAGKVGTGFDRRLLGDLTARLTRLERDTPPFEAGGPLPRKGVHWTEPELVGEVGFSEWTEDGQLRHPRFLGLRSDKAAAEVVRERPS